MSIEKELKKNGYDKDRIYDLAVELVEIMIEKQPPPEDLSPKEYMTMGAAAASASILSQISDGKLQ